MSSSPTGSARETLGVRDSDSAAVLAGVAASPVRIFEADGAFKAVVSCESLEWSVFDEPGGLDFAIFEDFLDYAVAGKRNIRLEYAKAKIFSCDSSGPHLPIAHG